MNNLHHGFMGLFRFYSDQKGGNIWRQNTEIALNWYFVVIWDTVGPPLGNAQFFS